MKYPIKTTQDSQKRKTSKAYHSP